MGYLSAREATAAPCPGSAVSDAAKSERWCILRTGGAKTVPLASSLIEAGYVAWTPTETIRAKAKGALVDRAKPIVPTFVFAKAAHVVDLLVASQDPRSRLPAFSVFRHGDHVPLIGGATLSALREAEELAALRYANAIERENAEERRQQRIAELRRAAAQRKALRAQPLGPLTLGTWVEVKDAPAMAGLTGQIVEERSNAAVVMFGGSMRMTIEAWQIVPASVDISRTIAA